MYLKLCVFLTDHSGLSTISASLRVLHIGGNGILQETQEEEEGAKEAKS